MKLKPIYQLFIVLMLTIAPATARDVEGIAAVVNDQVISLYDVDQRVDLFFVTSGIEKNPAMIERMREQVLRALVDEKLQMQEAARVEIEIEKSEIDQRMELLAKQDNRTLDGIKEFLRESEIEEETLQAQIRAELAWNQFVRRSYSSRIKVGDREIDEQFEKAVKAVNQTRYLVSEILLNLDNFSTEEQVRQLSDEIVRQLQSGVGFPAVARQFSIAPTAAQGGQLGWISANQLNPRLAQVIRQMQVGQISPPIPTTGGIYILALADKRAGGNDPSKNKFDVLTVGFPASVADDKIAEFVSDFKTCRRAQTAGKKLKASVKRSGLKELRLLPGAAAVAVANLEAGEVAAPHAADDVTNVYIVCDRKDDLGIEISRDQIADNIFSQRISVMARRHLRDLRRDAVVEYR
ncbi:MAG: peptidylprolyl isomerase [PS1 clade bacterium]|uniref:Parvulin-like PPIase n=1 Tax=PS1 clade bacterium TaxID=2175152 RepID=A0A937HI27_9PROT|nr:peptidylprolyl isomerase [PS1 clade bacterium]